MPHPYYWGLQSTIGRAETTETVPNTATFARPDSEISQSTVTTTVSDETSGSQGGSGGIFEGQVPLGEIK